MSANPFCFSEATFSPRLNASRRSRRSSALLITLTILALVTILVLAFLGLASRDLKSTYFYVRTEQADQIARGGLDFVVGNMEGEIQDSTLSTTNFGTAQSPFYVPNSVTNAFPMRMATLGPGSTNILLTSATNAFYLYPNGLTPAFTMASSIPSTNSSLNNQVITASDWNKPMLVPPANLASMPIPNWVFVSRTGPVSVSSGATYSTVTPNLSNLGGVIGRYAFVVYDTSGLLDINVAGYDPSQASMTANAPGKGLLPYADLTQLPGIKASDATTLVQFRNAVSETNFPLALTNTSGPSMVSNGFMQVYAPSGGGPSDTTFLSRQEFIQFANNNPDWANALPYLTTFSRELNGPTWGPTANATGATYQYLTIATNSTSATATTTFNPDTYAVRVPASWATGTYTRNNGLPWYAGDPLVKYRFPLDKLALLAQPAGTLTAQQIQEVQEYFGLDYVSSDSNNLYRHWQYPTANTAYLHTDGTILTLAQVAALGTPREPEFFELLQAGILNGSLGDWGRGDGSQGPADYDPKTTVQILRIGANIISQWKADNFPTTITYLLDNSGDSLDVCGIVDLPYITQMFTKCFAPNGNQSMPIYPYIYFQAWNPHQTPSAAVYNSANYPSSLRVVPYTYNPAGGSTHTAGCSDNYLSGLVVSLSGDTPGAYKWFYCPPGGWGSAGTNFFGIPDSYGGGSETDPSAGIIFSSFNPQTSYREPGLVVGNPNPAVNGTTAAAAWQPGSSLGGGSPSGPLGAISLPALPNFPATTLLSSSHPSKSGDTNAFWNASFASTNAWRVSFQTTAVMVEQFKDQGNTWHTYGTFEGMDVQSPAPPPTNWPGWNYSGFDVGTSSTSPNDQSFAKTDPRTFRLGPATIQQQQTLVKNGGYTVTTPVPNAANPPLLNPNSTLANIAWVMFGNSPFTNSASTATLPFRMDYWAANNPNNPIQGPFYTGTQTPTMADLDGAVRGGDSAYAYSTSSSAWGGNPEVAGTSFPAVALPARPVMLNHPFNSVGDLGYIYRDNPWRTLDFMTPASADAGLLDIFNLSEAPVIAGRINPNTPYPQVIASLISGATQSSGTVSGATSNVPASVAQSVGLNFVTFTATNSIVNRASIVTSGAVSNVINSGCFTDNGGSSLVKTEGESLVRALSESSNTRTWNLLIDVIGQSGHFVNNSNQITSGGTDNFVVDGERRYWLHIAIDRYTGKIVGEQLELVDQ
jgi:hypothetical protein